MESALRLETTNDKKARYSYRWKGLQFGTTSAVSGFIGLEFKLICYQQEQKRLEPDTQLSFDKNDGESTKIMESYNTYKYKDIFNCLPTLDKASTTFE